MANKGKLFEQDFQASAKKQGIWILRLNDTSLSWLQEKGARFTPANIADFLVFRKPNLFVVECKSTTYKRISIQRDVKEPECMIKAHQIQSLSECSLQDGMYAGFLLNYRNDSNVNDNVVYWMDIRDFNTFLVKEKDRKSISKEECEQYGGVVIGQKLKRVRFDYEIDDMLDKIVELGETKEKINNIRELSKDELVKEIFG